MTSNKAYLAHVMEFLTPHGMITSRAMFGGFGIYYKGVIFALILENELYFRIDDRIRSDFERYNSKAFNYESRDRIVKLPYMTLPEEIRGDPTLLRSWIHRSYNVSLINKMKKKPRKSLQ